MDKMKNKVFYIIFIILFVGLNLTNFYLLTSPNIIENLIPYKNTTEMIITSAFGNLFSLLIIIGVGYLLFKKRKGFYFFLTIFTIIISIMMFVLSVTCNYYGMMFSFDNLANLNLKNSGDSAYFFFDTIINVIKFSVPLFLLSGLILLVVFVLYVFKIKCEKEDRFINREKRLTIGALILLSGIFGLINVNLICTNMAEGTWFEYNTTPMYNVQTRGILSHIATETINLFVSEKELSEDAKEDALEYLESVKKEDQRNDYTGIFENKNLLLIQLESFNNFLVGLEIEIDGEFYEVTPNINKLVNENIYFNKFYTSTGMGNTSDAEFSVMTGLYPTGKSYAIYKYVDHKYQTLPSMFSEKGYTTLSTHANDSVFYTRDTVHTKMYGFDAHYGAEDLVVTDENLVHRWIGDEDLLKQTIDLMNSSPGNSFGFAITITNHTPYQMPKNGTEDRWFKNKENLLPTDYELSTDNRYNEIFTGYLEYAAYTDYAVSEAIKYLKEVGMYEDTVVMLYGDHGVDSVIYNMFYDYPEKFKNSINPIITGGNDNQKLLEYELLKNIPFIIASPELEQKTISLTRSNTTIQSTICNLFNLNQEYSFNIDALSTKKSLAYCSKTELIFYDDVILSSTSGDFIALSENYKNINQKLIEEYRRIRDYNEKILKYDLLRE